MGIAVGIAVGVANLCGSPSGQGDDAADPLHHLPLGDDQQVMDASRLQQVAETDRQTDFRLLPFTQNSGHMVTAGAAGLTFRSRAPLTSAGPCLRPAGGLGLAPPPTPPAQGRDTPAHTDRSTDR